MRFTKQSTTAFFMATFMAVIMPLHISSQEVNTPVEYELVYQQNFSNPQAFYDFDMTDATAWKINEADDNMTLELHGASQYRSKVRSPFNIALLKDLLVGDFNLEVDLAQSGREYGHRDLCLFFGFQNPTNFYYVHIASVADDNANNIFIVNDEPRTKIATKTTSGTDWGEPNSWHKVRIERRLQSGTIKIFFDDMKEPIMEATDEHFGEGRLGFGSFDDTGHYDNIKIWAPNFNRHQESIFKSSNQMK